MMVKRGMGEHASPDALQDPRDMVKDGLLEPQSPAMERHIPRHGMSGPERVNDFGFLATFDDQPWAGPWRRSAPKPYTSAYPERCWTGSIGVLIAWTGFLAVQPPSGGLPGDRQITGRFLFDPAVPATSRVSVRCIRFWRGSSPWSGPGLIIESGQEPQRVTP